MRYRLLGSAFLVAMLVALVAYAGNLSSSGSCPGSKSGTSDTPCSIGHAGTSTFTITTNTTGNAALVLPASSVGSTEIGANAVASTDLSGNSTDQSGFGDVAVGELFFCGESCSSSTCAGGHSVAFLSGDYTADHKLASSACNTLGETSIATADEAVSANNAFKVHGMYCVTDSSGSNGVILALTAAGVALTDPVTCTIPTGETTCTALGNETGGTKIVAAAAVVAVSIVTTEDLSANDFSCRVAISWVE